MKEYFKCRNCGKVVEGFHTACFIECCPHPRYNPLRGDLVVTEEIVAQTGEIIAVEGRVLSEGQIGRILHDHPRADIREA